MPHGLRYADALKLLGGSEPGARLIDNLLGGALSIATAGGSDLALSLFDAKAEAVRIGEILVARLRETVGGLGRYDRSQRLQAAHAVLVVVSFFEAIEDVLAETGIDSPGFARDDQVMLAADAATDGDWLARLLSAAIPVPAPELSYSALLSDLKAWYAATATRVANHLTGLAVWDRANERGRRALERAVERVPDLAVDRYTDAHRRLAVDIPEFDVWIDRHERQAIGRGLATLESLLLRAASSQDPDRFRAALATAYRAELDRPILGGSHVGDLVIPTLGEAYIDPRFIVKPADPGARPAAEDWWEEAPRNDFAEFLVEYLTTPQSAGAPLLLLGQPGAGKSSLTKILASRLPPTDFAVVRVALREVPAEAQIQDQVEQALRSAIGETVSWPNLVDGLHGAMPVVLLDGFDELLQATGVHQSDYLQRVAAFQQREATLGRPTAVMVTSRLAVADRARIPAGTLVVRLEPFGEQQIERWTRIWNAVNAGHYRSAGRQGLSHTSIRRFTDIAGQPLLLLMLALYDAHGDALSSDDESLDTGQLYELLLSDFAEREVRRLFTGQPDSAMPELVQAELLRLSVVAFSMFNRLRLWVTESELDADLRGLDLEPSSTPHSEAFRSPLTAGQEIIGRFFFIQRAQAVQESRTLQTYEFLHATFGEYLVARLVVQALKDAAARSAAGMLTLRAARPDDDLLQTLLGFTSLSARTTVIPFVAAMLADADTPALRGWLVNRLQVAMTRPEYVAREYRPVDKRIDHWMATYSFNLALLALACGKPLRASEIFRDVEDPAGLLRGATLQWRAAVPPEMWFTTVGELKIDHVWDDDRRDIILSMTDERQSPRVDPPWSLGFASSRDEEVGHGFGYIFDLVDALRSMQLGGDLREDVIRHLAEPMLRWLPQTCLSFVVHGPGDSESVGHSLLNLWLTSALADDFDQLIVVYQRAAFAVSGSAWGPPYEPTPDSKPAMNIFLRALTNDAKRLPAKAVLDLIKQVSTSFRFDPAAHLRLVIECVLRTRPKDLDPDLRYDTMVRLTDLRPSHDDEHERMSAAIRDLDLWAKP